MMKATEQDKKTFIAIIILNTIINDGKVFSTIPSGDDDLLEPVLIDLVAADYLKITNVSYQPTEKGRQALDLFMKRYKEYLKIYDIFGLVDTATGEFAFSRYYDFTSDAEWDIYKSNSRWEDMRVAVAAFKKMNPLEIVFMSFINEGRFEIQKTGWQMDLVSDALWKEVEDICNSSISAEEAGVPFMEDMIGQGADIMLNLLKKEDEIKENEAVKKAEWDRQHQPENEETEVIEEEEEGVTYYSAYQDPYYASSNWLAPLIIWEVLS